MNSNKEKGLALIRKLFADAATEEAAVLPQALSSRTVEHVFGDLWQQDGLSLQQRELVTSAMLIALNREAEQKLHFIAAKNLGIERRTIEAVITHAAYYAGWPCAVSAARVLHKVWPS